MSLPSAWNNGLQIASFWYTYVFICLSIFNIFFMTSSFLDRIHLSIHCWIYIFKNDLWVFVMKITTQLIWNVADHGWVTNNKFQSRLSKIALDDISFIFLSYWIAPNLHLILKTFIIKNCIEELCKIYLKWIMCSCAYMHKKITTAFVLLLLQVKLLLLSAAK